ncbi:MAG: hypothetical protein ABJP34_00080 [Erythrobacter sp.]
MAQALLLKEMMHNTPPQSPLRVLFYLPVITPWWFENIVIHLIRKLASDHEVHVMVPPLWRNTGVGPDQVPLIADLAHVHWHVLDGPDHPLLRTNASDQADLIELVREIGPQITLCRSADIKTPALFPGRVRYIMEAAAPPFETEPQWVWLAPTLFDAGILPKFTHAQTAQLDRLAEQLWPDVHAAIERVPSRHGFLIETGITPDRAIIGLALEYEHEENFFLQHHPYLSNAAMICAILDQLDERHVLAITNHPLNELYSDNSAIEQAVATSNGNAILLKNGETAGQTTLSLAQHASGMIIANSKSWCACAAQGVPFLRLSKFANADWLGTYNNMPEFLTDIASGKARRPDPKLARRWFGYHLANNAFDPAADNLSSEEIIDRALIPNAPERWTESIARYRAQHNKTELETMNV